MELYNKIGVVSHTHWRILLVLQCLLLSALSPLAAKTYIVCIGMQNYPGRVNDTHLCVKDAKLIKWIFEKNGDAEAMLVTDKTATKKNVVRCMKSLFAKAGANDAVAIFYSGHGDRGALCLYDGDLSYDDVWAAFKDSKAKRRFAFINACYSGTMRNEYDIKQLNGKDVMFLLSARSSETSMEILAMKHGVFPSFLHKGLRGAADKNKDRVITARELFDYVSSKVKDKTDDRQHPVAWGQFSDDMPIMVWK